MKLPVTAPHPAMAVTRVSAARGAFWALPLALALLFVAGVVAVAQRADRAEREARRKTMIGDTLSLEAQLRGRIETETATLRAIAAELPEHPLDGASELAAHPGVAAGLERLWLSVTWLDKDNRVVAQQRRSRAPGALRRAGDFQKEPGLSLHLDAASYHPDRPSAAHLVARYSPADLLKSKDFWWLAAKYDVELVSGLDQIIATTADAHRPARGESHSTEFEAIGDTVLRLTQREALAAWHDGPPLVLMAGFLLLTALASALLRREASEVSRAVTAFRTEAAWRRAMEDSALVGLRARDTHGKLLYVNRTFCQMVGYSPDQLLQASSMPFWPAESLDEVLLRNARNLEGRAPREGYEARWRHRSGQTIDVMVFESPLVDAHGVQTGWMGSIVDITERKRLEEVERRQTDAMAHHARLTTLGEIASTLAHELNQPLSAIASYSAGVMTALSKQPQLEPDVITAIELVGKHAAQAGRIVHRLRERLGRGQPRREAHDLNRIVDDALDLLKRDLMRQQVRVEKQLEPSLPRVVVDHVGIEQVVTNLIRNAVEALSTQSAERRITLSSSHERACPGSAAGSGAGDYVRISVADNGPGGLGRSIDALCVPFYSTKPGGMGMGLSICRSIVEAHHGVLLVDEAVGSGACFHFKLPAHSDDGARA